MGKARTAEAALEAEIEALEKAEAEAEAAAKRWFDKRDEAQEQGKAAASRVALLSAQIAARRHALALLDGDMDAVTYVGLPDIEAQNIAVSGTPVEVLAEGEMSEETKALIAAAHEGEEEDEADDAPAPQKKKRKSADEPDVVPLKPGQNPLDVLNRMRGEEEGTPAEA